MLRYGLQIGKKFRTDGSPLPYRGASVVCDILPSSDFGRKLVLLREKLMERVDAEKLIFLPENSFHITLMRGLNDEVREDAYWPESLPKDCGVREMDAFLKEHMTKGGFPEGLCFSPDELIWTEEDLRLRLLPSDDTLRKLRSYRDRTADSMSLRLPGHDEYRYHVTLAYTRLLPSDEEKQSVEELFLSLRAEDEIIPGKPYLAYYDDMLSFPEKPSSSRYRKEEPTYG